MVEKVLILNLDMSPLSITSLKRGFNLILTNKAEIIEFDSNKPIVTTLGEFKRPKVIKLLHYVYTPIRKIQLSRNNILKRDDFSCIYCDSKIDLTIDHVTPKSRGGENTWENLATCCFKCNKKKGRKTPEEAQFNMRHKPFKPNQIFYMTNMTSGFKEEWKIYFKKNYLSSGLL